MARGTMRPETPRCRCHGTFPGKCSSTTIPQMKRGPPQAIGADVTSSTGTADVRVGLFWSCAAVSSKVIPGRKPAAGADGCGGANRPSPRTTSVCCGEVPSPKYLTTSRRPNVPRWERRRLCRFHGSMFQCQARDSSCERRAAFDLLRFGERTEGAPSPQTWLRTPRCLPRSNLEFKACACRRETNFRRVLGVTLSGTNWAPTRRNWAWFAHLWSKALI